MSLPNLHSTTFDRPRPSSRLQPLTSPPSFSSSSLLHSLPPHELAFSSHLPLTPPTPSSHSSSSQVTSSFTKSSSVELCHVCGLTFKKAHLGVHRRSCIRRSMGRLATAHSASALASSPSCHPCFKCLQHIPSHLFSNHMQSCPGQQSKPLSSPPSSLSSSTSFNSSYPTLTTSIPNPTMSSKLTHRMTKLDSGVDIPVSQNPLNSFTTTTATTMMTSSLPFTSPPSPTLSQSPTTSVPGSMLIPNLSQTLTHPSLTGDGMEEIQEARQACSLCQRKFNKEVLDRHVQACTKLHSKKRHVFDMQLKRVKGTEMEKFVIHPPTSSASSSSAVVTKSKKKKPILMEDEDDGDDQEAIERYGMQGGEQQQQLTRRMAMDRPSPKFKKKSNGVISSNATTTTTTTSSSSSSSTSLGTGTGVQARFKFAADRIALDYVTCPTCLRRFNQEAAERHLDFCKQSKASHILQLKPSQEKLTKEEMLFKRTQYQPPPPISLSKAKKTQKKLQGSSLSNTTNQSQGPSIANLSNLLQKGQNEPHFKSVCGQCGHRFSAAAKFCASCGIHR